MVSPEQTMENLLQEFENGLNDGKKKNYMPILKDWFAHYILDQHKTIDDAMILFTHEITREDIINAGVAYVDGASKVTSTSAVDKYLTAVSMFSKTIAENYPQTVLQTILNYQDLSPDIILRAKKKLKEKQGYICLSAEEYKTLKSFIKNEQNFSYKQKVAKVCIELMLLFGFKIETLIELKKVDFIVEQRLLRRRSIEDGREFSLDLPHGLFCELTELVGQSNVEVPYLFVDETQRPISVQYLNDEFNRIREKTDVKISTTRLSKYGCVQLLLAGVPTKIVGQVTGVKSTHLKECQEWVSKILGDNTDRFLNSKIRGTQTFEDFT